DLFLHVLLVHPHIAHVEDPRLVRDRPHLAGGDVDIADWLRLKAVVARQVHRRLANRPRALALSVPAQNPGGDRDSQHRHRAGRHVVHRDVRGPVEGCDPYVLVDDLPLGHLYLTKRSAGTLFSTSGPFSVMSTLLPNIIVAPSA